MTSLDFLVHISCRHDWWNDAEITKISSNSIIFQEMLQMCRFPAFGRPRPPPQRRVLRTMYLISCWTSKHCAPAQRNRIFRGHLLYGDVILMAIFMISENRCGSPRFTQDHSRACQLIPKHHLNHPWSFLRTSIFQPRWSPRRGDTSRTRPKMKFWWHSRCKSEAHDFTRLSGACLLPPRLVERC